MPIVPLAIYHDEFTSLTLERYAQIVGHSECAIMGINNPADTGYCNTIWTLDQRKKLIHFLAEAQLEVESLLNYPLGPQWIVEKRRKVLPVMVARWGHLVEFGVQATTTIQAGAAVDHTADPTIIGPLATTVTDENEIVIYHPGTSVGINPSSVVIAGGNVTIEIPKCRMVAPAYMDTPEDGLNYADYSTWGEHTVDVKRVYTDPSQQATLVTNHYCNYNCATSGCTEYTAQACAFIRNPTIGSFELYRGTYSGGAWHKSDACCPNGFKSVELSYKAGWELTPKEEDILIHLTNAKMPYAPCGCDKIEQGWNDDQEVPDNISDVRLNCLWGPSNGAWKAWQWSLDIKLMRQMLYR